MSAVGPAARADFVGGLAWIAFGIAIVVASWTMDRLERFGATLYTVPGLVPGVLGVAIALLGAVLAVRAIRGGAIAELAAPWSPTPEGRSAMARVTVATALSLVYALVLVGRVPFPVATALFVFAFIMVFDIAEKGPPTPPEGAQFAPWGGPAALMTRSPLLRRAVIAAITALATSAVVSLAFERIFLVRLP